jgi:hypothetical protein
LVHGTDRHWQAFDATAIYNPEGNSGGAFGKGYWYYYPHENINGSCIPRLPSGGSTGDVIQAAREGGEAVAAEAPAEASPSAAPCVSKCWQPAVVKPPFNTPLVPKPVAPLTIGAVERKDVTIDRITDRGAVVGA